MSGSCRRFTSEYKIEAAHRVIDTGRSIAEAAGELSLNEGTLGNWVRDERRRQRSGDAPTPSGVSPNPSALMRLAGAVLIEAQDEWQVADKRYLSEATMSMITANKNGEVDKPELLTA